MANNSVLKPALSYLPSPPSEGDDEPSPYDASRAQRFREDVLFDLANLESSVTRIQLILSSNQRERERYAAEKAKILETAQAVRDNTVELRSNLQDSQEALERRKGYDTMAAKILDDKKLKSRDDAKTEIEKLEKEIEDLQHESAEYETTWTTRREQLEQIVREGEAMIRQIKGIKDGPEPEKDENMEDGEEEDENKDETSGANTPAQGGRSPQPVEGDATPLQESGEAGDSTPARPANKFLEVDDSTRTQSRVSSPLAQATNLQDDVYMAETPLDGGEQAPASASVDASAVATPAQDIAETMDET